eukprot:TRINITY_DN11123_c0_g1_i1.p1 TRINITY_DN11123_c0_g1~~TRINITY_DN11123_c0_g1_i1.p1  ORF type:complete len:581 (-),score=181.15 TRINITY_DN11123_c0_g1_i1:27-1769(-)
MQQHPHREVIVIGAGISGLGCARKLAENGRENVLILEARKRNGGRMHTTFEFTEKNYNADTITNSQKELGVDVGASFIHGTVGNPIFELCEEMGLEFGGGGKGRTPMIFDGEGEGTKMEKQFFLPVNKLLHFAMLEAEEVKKRMKSAEQEIRKQNEEGQGEKEKEKEEEEEKEKTEKESLVDFSLGECIEKLLQIPLSPSPSSLSISPVLSPSLSNFINQKFAFNWPINSPQYRFLQQSLWTFEQYDATNLFDLSLKMWDEGMSFSGGNAVVKNGYYHLIRKLEENKKFDIINECVVECVEYDGGESEGGQSNNKAQSNNDQQSPPQAPKKMVKIHTNQGIFTCDHVVVTLPLGVLKANRVKFIPDLPIWKKKSIDRLGYGLMNKIIVEFEERFWDADLSRCTHLSDTRGEFPWIEQVDSSYPLLRCWLAADFAKQLEELTDEQIITKMKTVLQKIFKPHQPIKITKIHITRWGKEEYSLGSYSYFKTRSSSMDCQNLAKPLGFQVFFAGEATNGDHIGTVHGAYISGVREAKKTSLHSGKTVVNFFWVHLLKYIKKTLTSVTADDNKICLLYTSPSPRD